MRGLTWEGGKGGVCVTQSTRHTLYWRRRRLAAIIVTRVLIVTVTHKATLPLPTRSCCIDLP